MFFHRLAYRPLATHAVEYDTDIMIAVNIINRANSVLLHDSSQALAHVCHAEGFRNSATHLVHAREL